jgi:peptide/nickel transport system permease protein
MTDQTVERATDLALQQPGTLIQAAPGRARFALLRDALRLGRTRIGLGIVVLIVAVALLGPLVAPHSPTEFVGVPNTPPGGEAAFGTDALGRDVLSRFLHGGLTVLWLSAAATLLGIALGTVVGLVAAYSRNWLDDVLMRGNDVLLAFPQIIFVLLAVSAIGPKLWLIVLTVGLTHAPRVARVIRGAALEIVERDFVTSAEVVGEKRWRIVFAEVLPNVTSPLLVEIGLRMTYSIGLVAGISFLGFGLQPPAADWGLMINENRLAITVQAWSVLLPVIAIGLLTIGTNLITDGLSRTLAGIDRRSDS